MKRLLTCIILTAVVMSANPLDEYILQVDEGSNILNLGPEPYQDWFSQNGGPIFSVNGVEQISLPNTGWDLCQVGTCVIPSTPGPTVPGNDPAAPEPATWFLMSFGLALLAWRRRSARA